jgi:UDP-N-acetyl-D-galactosamine dehydrogenase
MNVYQAILQKKTKIAVVGLGYVGLPLAVEFGKIIPTIGFDTDQKRVRELARFFDANKEVSAQDLRSAKYLKCTADSRKLRKARLFIVAVPTPVTPNKQPNLLFVRIATETVARNLKKGDIVVFEPTVYPGVTEEICVPILEKISGLKFRRDFKVGYSPERINPGDSKHTLVNTLKIVSACDRESLREIACIYEMIVKAGVYKAESIKTAEAAKVIENTQRDLNIALMNELALIFHKMGIDTRSVIEAAGTKWNFVKLFPGLVGGHCIGVDPYYLTYKAEELGYHPQVILSGRRINDLMGKFIAEETVKRLIQGGKTVKGAKVIVMGITFKENISDIRNSRVIDLVRELEEYGIEVAVCDPHADPAKVRREYGLTLTRANGGLKADALVLAVAHDVFKERLDLLSLKKQLVFKAGRPVVIDVKGMLRPEMFEGSGILYWRL